MAPDYITKLKGNIYYHNAHELKAKKSEIFNYANTKLNFIQFLNYIHH